MKLSARKQKLPALPNLQGDPKIQVKYYATSELAWRVGGRATVVILQQGESQSVTFVSGDLLAGGYQGTYHVQSEAEEDSPKTGDLNLSLSHLGDLFLEPVSQPIAARYLWGLFAFSLRQHTLDPEDFPGGPALGMVPPPRGKPFDWQRSLFKSLDTRCIEVAKDACDQIDLEPPLAEREAWPVVTIAMYPNAPSGIWAAMEGSGKEFVPAADRSGLTGFRWKKPKWDASERTMVYFHEGQLVTLALDTVSSMAIAMRLKALAPDLSCSPAVQWIPHDDIYANHGSRAKGMQDLASSALPHTISS